MTIKPYDYLRRYGDRYRLVKLEDGIWYIEITHRAREGMTYDVYDYSDELLAACLPQRTARGLLGRYPEAFTIHQDADDAIVLLFCEKLLHEMADALKLRRRRKLTDEQNLKRRSPRSHGVQREP